MFNVFTVFFLCSEVFFNVIFFFSPVISNEVSVRVCVYVCGSHVPCVCSGTETQAMCCSSLCEMRVSFFLLPSLPSPSYWKSCYKNINCMLFFLLLVFKNYKINITKSSSDHMTTVQLTSAFVARLEMQASSLFLLQLD